MLKNKTLGLALSGGGVRGALHIGVLEALEPHKDQIKALSGTSIGAVIGAFYAAGVPPRKMLEIISNQSLFSMARLGFNRKGLMEMTGLYKLLEKYVPKTFEELNIPLTVVTTDLGSDDYLPISSGDLHQAVVASCSIPVFFKATEIDGKQCVDGGLLNNLPANELVEKVDKIIGVHVNNYAIPEKAESLKTLADKVFSLVIRQNVKRYKMYCDYWLEPELPHGSVLDFSSTGEYYEIGRKAGHEFVAHPKQFRLKKHFLERFFFRYIDHKYMPY
ncbi:patatin-like phospholipase family protein [Roseivirga pacifica]|uniref:patatin-like phospholipase family protein n=1 Tax=Roseivirga pacifica TaxID=1267423 RepID=UPI002094E7E1|nr:patatin-like phospholipase family protein [Roseivirga pacifica]MCO6357778.1 hypothetical protein [Roseivirga pacifica]MCO6366031.1 hypothetical protein [Roseivirga pacifica]MCO6371359.1 hypothetical protein [Roseivirga pacifica]MCO6375469.1 hypothetical protein [Roseivirga pacifica]MCO6378737.1 hypothetical protein [Roseivirga pacifica]